MKRRIVVTGLGIVSSIGLDKNIFWKNLIAGKSGISEVSTFYSSSYSLKKGGSIKDFNSITKLSKDMGRASQFALEVSCEAINDARLSYPYIGKNRCGVIFGTTNGESNILEEINRIWLEKGESEIWAQTIVKFLVASISNNIGYLLKINGMARVIPTACSAGNYCIGHAYDLIKNNRLDIVVVGGTDPLTRYAFAGFGRMFAMAQDKCQPFDKNRKGMMVGEGAGALILEELEAAKKRKANIYCEILGYGLSCDAHHMTAPSVNGILQVMEKAIKNSKIEKKEVDYICAHGTGTPANDKAECEAIKKVFGERTKKISVSSIKSMLGHTMGAASAIEAVACCLAIKNNVVPPTINYETHDSECDIDCVPNVANKRVVDVALNNSFAFGGNNACLVLRRYE